VRVNASKTRYRTRREPIRAETNRYRLVQQLRENQIVASGKATRLQTPYFYIPYSIFLYSILLHTFHIILLIHTPCNKNGPHKNKKTCCVFVFNTRKRNSELNNNISRSAVQLRTYWQKSRWCPIIPHFPVSTFYLWKWEDNSGVPKQLRHCVLVNPLSRHHIGGGGW
jgi:hypothetical protein